MALSSNICCQTGSCFFQQAVADLAAARALSRSPTPRNKFETLCFVFVFEIQPYVSATPFQTSESLFSEGVVIPFCFFVLRSPKASSTLLTNASKSLSIAWLISRLSKTKEYLSVVYHKHENKLNDCLQTTEPHLPQLQRVFLEPA